MCRKFITLLLIISLSLYCSSCREHTFYNTEQEVQESYLQENETSREPVVQNPNPQKEDASGKNSEENLPMTKKNTIENWLFGVAQQVLALAIWYGIKQTIKIIILKRYPSQKF